jgi:tRNA nucleotidyltransferase/poly(A) polymerase
VLPAKKGLNRLVWDLRYETLPGVPEVYIEGSFRGHKAIPGDYKIILKFGGKTMEAEASLLNNPVLPTSAEEFADYHEFMAQTEATYTEMTELTNKMYAMQSRLKTLKAHLSELGKTELVEQAQNLLDSMDTWDKIMAQRLSKAYDDVENYVNGFTAEYLTALNHADSAIPRVNKGTKEKIEALNAIWNGHRKAGLEIVEHKVESLNNALQESGIGVLY